MTVVGTEDAPLRWDLGQGAPAPAKLTLTAGISYGKTMGNIFIGVQPLIRRGRPYACFLQSAPTPGSRPTTYPRGVDDAVLPSAHTCPRVHAWEQVGMSATATLTPHLRF
jgi:hypothetical protein